LRHIPIPPLVLQPLVENAVKHGIAHKQIGGEVTIRANTCRRSDRASELVLTVRDTGAGSTPVALEHGRQAGVGLQNVERRLAHLYGERASLSIQTAMGEGTTVEIRLPVSAGVLVQPTAAEATK
jgi:sensor histidine kinase YesM